MGGGSSKQSHIREIDSEIDAQFRANCNASASGIQVITLKDVTIIARDNCRFSAVNKASLNSTCEMSPIFDAIAEMAVNTDMEFAQRLQDAQDRQANMKCDADNCEDRLKVSIKRRLASACDSKSRAIQTVNVLGGTIFCDGNTIADFGNQTEIRATCLSKLLHDVVEEMSPDKTDPEDITSTLTQKQIMLLIVLLLIAVLVLSSMKK